MKLGQVVATSAVVAVAAVAVALTQVGALKDEAASAEPPKTVCTPAPAIVCDALDLNAPKGSPQYRRVEIPSDSCVTTQKDADGKPQTVATETVPMPDAGRLLVLKDSCRLASVEGGTRVTDGGVKYAAQRCFCRAASGACAAPWLPDGGAATVPLGMTALNATGAGCVPKSCIELLGNTSWPSACPGG